MISLIMTIALFAIPGISAQAPPVACAHFQSLGMAVIPFNSNGMPVRINTAMVENSVGVSSLEYSISNTSGDEITAVYLRVFVLNGEGKLIKVRDGFSQETIAAGATQSDSAQIKHVFKQPQSALVAVRRVVSGTGVWRVYDSELEDAIRSKLSREPEVTAAATFEPNVIISDEDRSQIFGLVLSDIVHDQKKAERLLGQSRLVVLRDSVNFPLPYIPQANLVTLNLQEIHNIADKEQRVVYLKYEPLTAEGSRVIADIALRDIRARTGPRHFHIPYKFIFQFTCIKENGRWIIEKSVGIAQS